MTELIENTKVTRDGLQADSFVFQDGLIDGGEKATGGWTILLGEALRSWNLEKHKE